MAVENPEDPPSDPLPWRTTADAEAALSAKLDGIISTLEQVHAALLDLVSRQERNDG